ncbi:MAG: glycosyltransferase [Planctomycetota bacterium]
MKLHAVTPADGLRSADGKAARADQLHWYVAAPFFGSEDSPWFDLGMPEWHSLRKIPRPTPNENWHNRGGTSPMSEWRKHNQHAKLVWEYAVTDPPSGIVTLFPQLPVLVGMRQRFKRRKNIPVVAWTFNLGKLHGGLQRSLARFALKHVDRFIVHSRFEVKAYAEWIGWPEDRFTFMPLQRGMVGHLADENEDDPFILAMGTAKRDYRTLGEAAKRLGHRVVIVAGQSAVEGLDLPDNVEVHRGLSLDECRKLEQEARVNVVPIDNEDTASGQVTVINAMMSGRALIATDSPGTVDYIEHEQTGLLVKNRDVDELTRTIDRLWTDETTRNRLGAAARLQAAAHYSDEAAARNLQQVLDEVGHARNLI